MNKTILIFTAYYLPHLGGIERYLDNLMHELVKLKVRVILVTSNYNDDKKHEVQDGIEIYRIPVFNIFKNRYPIFKLNSEERGVLKELDKEKIDAIIVNTRFHLSSHIGAKYGKKRSIPVFLIEHGSQYVTLDNKFIDFFANRYEDFLTWKIRNKITAWYGASPSSCNWLKHFNIEAAGYWNNGINTNLKLPEKKKHQGINFLYAGRLIKQKGVGNILEAFTELEKKYNNIKINIAGSGAELDYYKENYKSKNIKFLGQIDFSKLLEYFSKSDVFLYPSLWPEALASSVLEAGLMEVSTIGTTQPGIIDILDENNGILIDGSVEELKESMELLIKDKELGDKLAKQLHKDVLKKFAWNNNAKKVLKDIDKYLK